MYAFGFNSSQNFLHDITQNLRVCPEKGYDITLKAQCSLEQRHLSLQTKLIRHLDVLGTTAPSALDIVS